MPYKSRLPLLLTAFAAVFFLSAPDARACSCAGKPTVLEAYENAQFVVVTRVVSVEKTEKAAPDGQISDGETYVDGVKSTTMRVERVYKGNLKVGDEMTFAQGGGADCIWTFAEQSVGQKFLFYLNRMKNSPVWYAGTCGRSSGVNHAGDDLLYLEKMGKARGKTRLSGTLETWSDDGPDLGGRVLSVTGGKKTYEVKTDANGVYELYDLPAGKYVVSVEPPAGWKVVDYSAEGRGARRSHYKTTVEVEAGRHTALDIRFDIDNAIRGKVLDAGGKPLEGVCVTAVRAESKELNGDEFDCTEEDGGFNITELAPGNYVLVANDENKITSSEPFPTLFYPNVFERERAGVVTVRAGDHLEGFDIFVPKVEETVTIEGVLLYSDGKPVAAQVVRFKAGEAKANVDGDVYSATDERGRFRIKILKGLGGELFGSMLTYEGEFEKCPKLDALIKEVGGSVPEIKTPALKIRADSDLFDAELKFPFPLCKKAKRPGE